MATAQVRDCDAHAPVPRASVERLAALCTGQDEDLLDGVVHDLKDDEAARINNGGQEAQIAYLVAVLGEAEAERTIRGELT